MRKLKLWNYLETESIDFNASGNLATEPKGLGSGFGLKKGTNSVYGFEYNFEPIVLKLNFGTSGNAYTKYKDFMTFIVENGEKHFVLEYNYNGTNRYCDVWVETITKGEKDNYSILREQIVFNRASAWYEKILYTSYSSYWTIENTHFLDLPLNLEIKGTINSDFVIELKDESATVLIKKTQFNLPNEMKGIANSTLTYDTQKKRTFYTKGNTLGVENAYGWLSKGVTYNTFLTIPQGKYRLSFTQWSGTPTYKVKIKKWVGD